MLKAQNLRVQGLAGQCLQRGGGGIIKVAGAAFHARAVKRVAQHRVSDMRHMHANLVRAAGFQMAGKARDLPVQKAFLHLIMGDGVARALMRRNSHFPAVVRRARKRRIHLAKAGQGRAPHQRLIAALHAPVAAMGSKLRAEREMRSIGFGRYHDAACVLVEAVDNARALFPANTRQRVAAMGDERVDERCLTIAGRRMHHHARWLVQHDELVILVQNIQRDVLAGNGGFSGWWHGERNLVIRFDPPGRVFYRVGSAVAYRASFDSAGSGFDKRLQARAADFRRVLCQYLVEARAVIFGAYHKAYLRGG